MDNKEYAMIIAKNLRRIMYDHGKTQADVARDLHISKATLSSWMNGTRIPRMNNIDMLCHYFNVKRADIMEEQLEVQTSGHPEWYDYPKTTKYMETGNKRLNHAVFGRGCNSGCNSWHKKKGRSMPPQFFPLVSGYVRFCLSKMDFSAVFHVSAHRPQSTHDTYSSHSGRPVSGHSHQS